MSQSSQQAITHVLQQDSKLLNTLLAKIHQLNSLQQLLCESLDAKLAQHCQIANLENGSLIILTDSAIWATQIRFQAGDLLAKLRLHPLLHHLKNISCITRPAPVKQQEPAVKPMPRLSTHTAELIKNSADTIQHDKLKTALNKIAQHIKHNA
ncbi:MAG: DciA family protein [Gammaproteobacteria bacterium]|nr:DciA family protein [Gammaproteobacteria bacterium]